MIPTSETAPTEIRPRVYFFGKAPRHLVSLVSYRRGEFLYYSEPQDPMLSGTGLKNEIEPCSHLYSERTRAGRGKAWLLPRESLDSGLEESDQPGGGEPRRLVAARRLV